MESLEGSLHDNAQTFETGEIKTHEPTEEERLIRSTYTSLVKITAGLYVVFASFAGMLIFVAASGESLESVCPDGERGTVR